MENFPARHVWIPEGMCYVCWQMNMIPDTPSAVSLFVVCLGILHQTSELLPSRTRRRTPYYANKSHMMLSYCHSTFVLSPRYVGQVLVLCLFLSVSPFNCIAHFVFWVMLTSFPCSVPFSPVLRVGKITVAEDHMPPSSLAKQFQNPPDIWSMTEKVVVECSTDRCLKNINNVI